MQIIIVGAGEVGSYLAQRLSALDLDVVLIEQEAAVVAEIQGQLDVRVLHGSGAVARTLRDAGVEACDLFLALTREDHTNFVSALLARRMGAKHTIARIHAEVMRDEALFDYRAAFQLDYVFSAERLAAVELAKFIRNPHQPIVEEIARGRIELQQFELDSDSPTIGKSLKALAFPPRVRIGSIRRDGRSYVPKASDELRRGDTVTLFGQADSMRKLLSRLKPDFVNGKHRSVLIAGGGEVTLALAQLLQDEGYRIRIMDSNPDSCDSLSRLLPQCTIIHADPTHSSALAEERIHECSYFVAAMADDKDNVMTCLQAGHLGAAHCISVIQREDYAEMIQRAGDQVGIQNAVSPREAVRRDLMRFITSNPYHVFSKLDEETELVHFTIGTNSQLAGLKVQDLELPEGLVMVARVHDLDASVPAAGDVLRAGDTVYALIEICNEGELLKFLKARNR